MKTTIYRLASIKNHDDGEFLDYPFLASKEKAMEAIADYCDRLTRWGRNPSISKYARHPWDNIHFEGEGWKTMTIIKEVTFNGEICGEKYTKKLLIGYVQFELES